MLSVASLLNPISEPRATRLPSSPSSSLCTTTSSHGSPRPSTQASNKKQKMIKDGAHFVKGKAKGEVNYPPFEHYERNILEEIQKFGVFPIHKIREYPRHIPYNSEKKSFLEKTGRESFEVFQYIFKVPGDDKEYTVLWDYNIGLVRITPFFKSLGHTKTMPAKMLNQNPGLKEITHSITGGALAAQGYWMPYNCAFAVCTTFCARIAPALIPIFGPSFPSHCVDPEAPEHGRMIIDPALVQAATDQAEKYRIQYSSITPRSTPRESYSPAQSLSSHNSLSSHLPSSAMRTRYTPPSLDRRLRLKRAFGSESPYGPPIDTDFDNTSETSSGDGYFCSPPTPSSMASQLWSQHAARNVISHSANSLINIAVGGPKLPLGTTPLPSPWLSAIPRSTGLSELDIKIGNTSTSPPVETWRGKRRVEELDADADAEYDGEESGSGRSGGSSENSDTAMSIDADGTVGGAEKKAAWLLMNLSVKDGEFNSEGVKESDGPRVKRRRAATSL